jgi:hypothetical protein
MSSFCTTSEAEGAASRSTWKDPFVTRLAVACALGTLALAGCADEPALSSACLDADPRAVLDVLRHAPARAALPDGTPLSACIDHAENDAQLQTLGLTMVAVADRLARDLPTSSAAAFQLGWLIGAAERGAGPTGGTQAELVQRLEQAASFRDGARLRRAEVMRGIAAGKRDG